MLIALFGIDDGALNLVVNLLVLFLVVVWLALIFWTYRDAKERIEDPVLVMSAAAASIFPFVGTVVYTILRPPEFLEDAKERELEIEASQLRVRQLREQACPNCEHPVERSFLRCPSCQVRLKDPCSSCSQPVDPRWSVCPYCETPLRSRSQAPGERRKPARGGEREKRREPARAGSRATSPRPSAGPSPARGPVARSKGPSSGSRPDGSGTSSGGGARSDGRSGSGSGPRRSPSSSRSTRK